MQENHIDEVSQLGRHLSTLLKWSVIDRKLFEIHVTPLTILRPALHLNNLKVILEENPGIQTDNILDVLIENTYTALSAIMSILLYNSVQCRGLGSHPLEANIKIQMWLKILTELFVLDQIRFEPVRELNHLIPGNAKEGSKQ
ncbi:7270_t:CDS:2 [Diversispora eburnea]|uniref:7270_t:CDS:1 n=1 Tax=Diversispora eburnea TaxID=1213867 RepID=A0A9N8V2B8_9GLOM|nr:7270_t:CDS:2 [Diversispora eburnea]